MTTPRTACLLLALVVLTTNGCQDDAARQSDSVAAAAPSPDSLPPDTGWVATARGLGGVHIGMRRADLLPVIGRPSRAGYYTHERCTFIGGTALPPGVQVMVFDSTVARIDVSRPGVRTREGAQVGDTETAVVKMYDGRVAVTPHRNSGPQWHYLTVTPPGDTLHRIVFETDGATVQNYRVGRRPEVEWTEGCS